MLTLKEFDQAYQEVTPRVRAFLYHNGVPAQELDDVVQQAWYLVWKRRAQYRGECSLSTWLFKIAWNVWRMRARRHDSVVSSEIVDSVELPSVVIHIEAEEVLSGIRPSDRLVLTRFYSEGWTMEELSAELHLPVAAIKTRVFRARAYARKYSQVPSEGAKRQSVLFPGKPQTIGCQPGGGRASDGI